MCSGGRWEWNDKLQQGAVCQLGSQCRPLSCLKLSQVPQNPKTTKSGKLLRPLRRVWLDLPDEARRLLKEQGSKGMPKFLAGGAQAWTDQSSDVSFGDDRGGRPFEPEPAPELRVSKNKPAPTHVEDKQTSATAGGTGRHSGPGAGGTLVYGSYQGPKGPKQPFILQTPPTAPLTIRVTNSRYDCQLPRPPRPSYWMSSRRVVAIRKRSSSARNISLSLVLLMLRSTWSRPWMQGEPIRVSLLPTGEHKTAVNARVTIPQKTQEAADAIADCEAKTLSPRAAERAQAVEQSKQREGSITATTPEDNRSRQVGFEPEPQR